MLQFIKILTLTCTTACNGIVYFVESVLCVNNFWSHFQ